ncbi:MAG TPA: RING finger family 4 domain-containing protein, partial [Streptomyces sp.]|nr:RING finger family 4 domain-containing protein [Streptomyces sp.]
MGVARAAGHTDVTTATAADDLEGLLLRRSATVYVNAPADRPGDERSGGGRPGDGRPGSAANAEGLSALEAELALRGHVLTAPLRRALAALAPAELAAHGIRLLGRIDALLGADRHHVPLFRHFPDSVPDHAHSLYSELVLAFLLSQPHQPCLACGRTGDIGALAPCAHLVCSACLHSASDDAPAWEDFACPVCGSSVTDRTAPYLDPSRPRPRSGARQQRWAGRKAGPRGEVLRPLRLGGDDGPRGGALTVLADLLARRTPLSPQEREDLTAVLPYADPGLGWLPEEIPVRETKAVVLAALLHDPRTAPAARESLSGRLDTATDVLRLLWAYSGGEPDLLDPPRLRSVPRPLRRELLGV